MGTVVFSVNHFSHMKTFLLVLALVQAAAAISICFPDVYQWTRQGQFVVNNKELGVDGDQEYFDEPRRMYRFTRHDAFDGKRFLVDNIADGEKRLVWTIKTNTGSGEITCTVHNAIIPHIRPCLFQNATLHGRGTYAGSVLIDRFEEEGVDTQGHRVYSEIVLAAGDNAPVLTRTFIQGVNVYEHNEYYDYSVELPPNAFEVPAFCPSAPPANSAFIDFRQIVGNHRSFYSIYN